jgi:putative aldouronate transport system substrate-binding protein
MEVFSDGKKALPAKEIPDYQKLIDANENYAVPDPTVSLISETYLQKSQQLTQIISDAQTKYIIGELDDAGFQAAVDNWRKSGGDQVIREFTDQYKKLHP